MDSEAIKEKHLGISGNKRGKLTFDIEWGNQFYYKIDYNGRWGSSIWISIWKRLISLCWYSRGYLKWIAIKLRC